MYLSHHTTIENLYMILLDSCLKLNHLTNKINLGEGVYNKKNKFIYFGIERKLFANPSYNYIKLYFNHTILSNRNFYLATMNSLEPDKEYKYVIKNSQIHQLKKI